MTNATDALRALETWLGTFADDIPAEAYHKLCAIQRSLASPATINHDGIDRKLIDDATPAGSASGEDYAARQAEVARLREDATRYRWLRMQNWFSGSLCVLRDPKKVLTSGAALGADCPSRERLDAAIDAAMGSANGQG